MARPTVDGELALRRIRIWSMVLLATVVAVVGIITFSPGSPDPSGQEALRSFLDHAHMHGFPRWISFNKIEFGANIVMFLPIGMFGALALPKHRWLIVPAAIVGSVAIEITQASGLPERVGTPRDVIANSLGAVLGYLLASLVVWSVKRGSRRRSAYEWLATIQSRPAPPPLSSDN